MFNLELLYTRVFIMMCALSHSVMFIALHIINNIMCRSIKLEITLNGFTYVASHVVLEIDDCKVRT